MTIAQRNIVAYVVPSEGLKSQITTAGKSERVSSKDAIGGYIVNPYTAVDQGTSLPAVLYVDPTGAAATNETVTTVALQPGERYLIQPNVQDGVWVNSLVAGHKFTVVQILPSSIFVWQPVPGDGIFPPTGPSVGSKRGENPLGSVSHAIRSYLYQEYSDDEDLQAFVKAYNDMVQEFVDTFLNLNLPNYTQDPVSGALLDWVGAGIYGMPRPSMSSGAGDTLLGPYNTLQYNQNQFVYDPWAKTYSSDIALVDDDMYRRVLTWHYEKGMGKYFSVPWLKKRIMQFIIGIDGKCINIDNTYRVSITFGQGCEIGIRLITGLRTVTCSTMYNDDCFKYNAMCYNELDSTYIAYQDLPGMQDFANAVKSGILEMPFQFTWDVTVN